MHKSKGLLQVLKVTKILIKAEKVHLNQLPISFLGFLRLYLDNHNSDLLNEMHRCRNLLLLCSSLPKMFKAYHKYTIRCAFNSRFTHGKWLLPTQNPLYMCKDFPMGNLLRGNFHGYFKRNKRITHDSSRGMVYGLIRTQSGATNHEKVKCTEQ